MGTKNKNSKKIIEHYMSLPWTYTIETAKENGKYFYIVRVNELPGICTDASTITEAMRLIKEAMVAAFQLYLENNEEIPEPINENQYKGNIAYRTTRKRHYGIAKEAQRRKASLSEIIDECIDQSLYSVKNIK